MEIAFFCADNSPTHHFCPDDLWGRGLGGAEQYLISLAEELARKHKVTVFNQPPEEGMYGRVLYTHTDGFDCQRPYDCFILYRNPDVATTIATAAKVKLFLSCDQQTSGDYRTDAFPHVDHTLCISPYHVNYHRERYGVAAERISHIEIGVRQQDYTARVTKVPGQCIYCSIPDRGLEHLAVIWPQIKERVPHATLFITSDYRLWGLPYPSNQGWVERFRGMPGVRFVGRVAREELVGLQLSSDLMVYPSDYEELFCVSAAECMVAGAYPITSTFGALPTTAGAGTLITGVPASASYQMAFVERAVSLLRNPEELAHLQSTISAYAKGRFRYSEIADRWIGIISNILKRPADQEVCQMRCTYIKKDGQRCRRQASKGQRYCWTHERVVKADPTLANRALGPGPRLETKKRATLASQAAQVPVVVDAQPVVTEIDSAVITERAVDTAVTAADAAAVAPQAHPKTKKSAAWHFPSLGGPEGLGVVEYGLPECKDEKLVAAILATPYLQLISCHRNGTILNRFMARPCAAKHHEHWRMGLLGLSRRFPENHFDVGILAGPQSGDVVQAMERLVKGPVIRV